MKEAGEVVDEQLYDTFSELSTLAHLLHKIAIGLAFRMWEAGEVGDEQLYDTFSKLSPT